MTSFLNQEDVYIDESSTNMQNSTMVFGSIWVKSFENEDLSRQMDRLKFDNNLSRRIREFHFSELNIKKFDYYKNLIDWFFLNPVLYKCIIIMKDRIDYSYWKDKNQIPYSYIKTLLRDKFVLGNTYRIWLDTPPADKTSERLSNLKKSLRYYTERQLLSAVRISDLKYIDSEKSNFIQLCDVLTGLVARRFNHTPSSNPKDALVNYLEQKLNQKLTSNTSPIEEKFNRWIWRPIK